MTENAEETEETGFTKEDIKDLRRVFTLARVNLVTTDPNNVVQLSDLINFEIEVLSKIKEYANKTNSTG